MGKRFQCSVFSIQRDRGKWKVRCEGDGEYSGIERGFNVESEIQTGKEADVQCVDRYDSRLLRCESVQVVMDLSTPDAVFSGRGQREENFPLVELHKLEIACQFASDARGIIGQAAKAQASAGERRENLGQRVQPGDARMLPEHAANTHILSGLNKCGRVPVSDHREFRSARMAETICSAVAGAVLSMVNPCCMRVRMSGTSAGLTMRNVMSSEL